MKQPELFEKPAAVPHGFVYRPDFITAHEESALLAVISELSLKEAQYRQWNARRRIVSYGGRYDFSHHELLPAEPIPRFLHPLRDRIAEWTGIPVARLNHAVVAEYCPGTQLGWHRDAPDFDLVAGVSLLNTARMRFRRYPPKEGQRRAALALDLEPRSAYIIQSDARWKWQHAISPTKGLRYSITFRTLVDDGPRH